MGICFEKFKHYFFLTSLLRDSCSSKRAAFAQKFGLKNILKHPEFTWGSENLSEAGSIRKQYIESLQAADGGNYEPLLTFVRT